VKRLTVLVNGSTSEQDSQSLGCFGIARYTGEMITRTSLLLPLFLSACVDYGFSPSSQPEPEPLDTSVIDTGTPQSILVVSPERVDFGEVELGESQSAIVMLRNNGSVSLDLTDIDLVADGTPFTVGPATDLELSPDEVAEVVVTYAPVEGIDHENAIAVESTATVDPNWRVPLTGSGLRTEFAVDMQLTADDSWSATLDGDPIGGTNQNLWTYADVLVFDLDRGDHVVAVHAWDVARVISGVMAVVRVDGEPIAASGGSGWSVSTTAPPAGWDLPGFDDSSWGTPYLCSDPSPWGNRPTSLTDDGAEWVWHDANCRSLGEGWYRLSFTLE
jgi:hypothetical protein